MPTVSNIERAGAALRAMAMAYPEAYEDFPWGEVAIKVHKKVFLFLHIGAETLSLSCKLPQSCEGALLLPFAKPTGYGLGKSGWVSARFAPDEEPPLAMLREWIDESYRAVAPKKLAASLGGTEAVKIARGAKPDGRNKRTAETPSGRGATAAKKAAKVGSAKKAAKAR